MGGMGKSSLSKGYRKKNNVGSGLVGKVAAPISKSDRESAYKGRERRDGSRFLGEQEKRSSRPHGDSGYP